MCSDVKTILIVLSVAVLSCSPLRKLQYIRSGAVAMQISVPEEEPEDDPCEVDIDSIVGSLSDGPVIMNAIRDSETGEMVATDVINASKVIARFRNVAERDGYVSIGFDVSVPSGMSDSRWQLKLYPEMRISGDTVALEPVFITGEAYRAGQMRGYQRYHNFISSIVTDSLDLIWTRQLEIFLQRHFPETYAMKTDSSLVSDPVAENLFGVTQADALKHYRKTLKIRNNERRKSRMGKMYDRYVKDPIVTEGIRLDTILTASDGDFLYRYVHTFRSRPALKKVMVTLAGEMFEDGESICRLPFPEDLTFYISSLSSMADLTPKYRMMILERTVYDNTKALIDFRQGSAVVDTSLSDNASELNRVISCVDDVVGRKEFELDSLVIMASCSPEGEFRQNSLLSAARSDAVREYMKDYVPAEWKPVLRTSSMPENWDQFRRIVANDTVIGDQARRKILTMTEDMDDPDRTEKMISEMPEYRYLREKIYPKLRSVSFDFHLHRVGMQKDTVHTTELDTVYMEGLDALRELDYKRAVTILRPYDDYNSALAFVSAGYDRSALDVLDRLDTGQAKVCYLKAMVLSRLGIYDEAMKYYELSIARDPYLEHRANLDPEMFVLVNKINKQL